MDVSRFDQLAKATGQSGSRRRLFGALLAAIVAGLHARGAAADEGTVVADASGGNRNLASSAESRRELEPEPEPEPDPEPAPCRPEPTDRLCQGRCKRDVADGCGGRVRCTCSGGELCGPGNRCCPRERLCLPSDTCCAPDLVCAPGGGVCCAPGDVCDVGGVADACCTGIGTCDGGVCFP